MLAFLIARIPTARHASTRPLADVDAWPAPVRTIVLSISVSRYVRPTQIAPPRTSSATSSLTRGSACLESSASSSNPARRALPDARAVQVAHVAPLAIDWKRFAMTRTSVRSTTCAGLGAAKAACVAAVDCAPATALGPPAARRRPIARIAVIFDLDAVFLKRRGGVAHELRVPATARCISRRSDDTLLAHRAHGESLIARY